MVLQSLAPLLTDGIVLVLLLLPGYVATEAFIWRSGIGAETTQLYHALWSLVVGVISLPIIIGLLEVIDRLFPSVADIQLALLFLVVLVVAVVVGTTAGDWVRVWFKGRYGATPSLNTGWGYLHHRAPSALVRVVTTDGTEVIGRVKFVGQTSPHENVEIRDLLLRQPCVLTSERTGSTPTGPERYLYLYGDEIARLHVLSELATQTTPRSNYWVKHILLRFGHGFYEKVTGGDPGDASPGKPELSGDPLELSKDGVVTVDGEPPRVTGIVRNRDDVDRFGEVTVTFRGPAGEFLSMNHCEVPTLDPGTETRVSVPYDGPQVDTTDLSYTAAVTVRHNVQIPEKPTLRPERQRTQIEFPIRNTTKHRTVYYCVVRVRLFTADGSYLDDRYGTVRDIPPKETAVIPVTVPKHESEFRFAYKQVKSYMTG
jgi:hypothetical protein